MTVAELDLLEDADVLGHGELAGGGDRGDEGAGETVVGGVRCGRPLVYRVPVERLPGVLRLRGESSGCAYVGVLFAFDLELPATARCRAVRFEVSLGDGRAVRIDEDGDGLGVTFDGEAASDTAAVTVAAVGRKRARWLRGRTGLARPQTLGMQSPRFAWLWGDAKGGLPRSYGMHALVEVPSGAEELRGQIDVQVELGTRGNVASLRRSLTFAEALIPAGKGAAVRLCVASDVAGYSRRSNAETERIQADLVDVLARARKAAGIAESAVRPQAQGDGQFTVLPVGIDESVVIPRLVAAVSQELRRRDGRMRVRLALHRGLVKEGPNGWIGAAPIAVHRILDCDPLRAALAGNPGADFVLGVPDSLYRDVIVPGAEPPRADEFTAMPVEVPSKGFVEHCWLHIGSRHAGGLHIGAESGR